MALFYHLADAPMQDPKGFRTMMCIESRGAAKPLGSERLRQLRYFITWQPRR
ncbi:MAG: hypothetical protein HY741_16710 [Chloroflexi bacterium]|nr:hypothetical protein [Chloroflexota bacterium]